MTRRRRKALSGRWGLCEICFDGVLSFEMSSVLNSFPEEMREEVFGFNARIGEYFAGKIETP